MFFFVLVTSCNRRYTTLHLHTYIHTYLHTCIHTYTRNRDQKAGARLSGQPDITAAEQCAEQRRRRQGQNRTAKGTRHCVATTHTRTHAHTYIHVDIYMYIYLHYTHITWCCAVDRSALCSLQSPRALLFGLLAAVGCGLFNGSMLVQTLFALSLSLHLSLFVSVCAVCVAAWVLVLHCAVLASVCFSRLQIIFVFASVRLSVSCSCS